MKVEVQRRQRQELAVSQAPWDYDSSVATMKPLVYKWKNLTGEMLGELHRAREVLSIEGRPRKTGTNVPVKTWVTYCRDIGIEKRTANRWLNLYFGKPALPGGHSYPIVVDEGGVVTSLEDLVASGRTFRTIYADPPWSYGNQGTRAATSNHYHGLTVDEICELPMSDIADDEAHLHLWTTNAFLFEAQKVMDAWGFEYKSVMLWVKPQMGIGNYWRVCHEFLLFGIRGDMPMTDAHTTIRSWQEEPRIGHSVKPEKFRQLIEQVSYAPRFELFGRKAMPGWTVYGDQILGYDLYGATDRTPQAQAV